MDEEHYHAFDDPVHDQMLGIVLALGAEVWSLRDRLGLMEQALAEKNIDVSALVEQLARDPDRIAAMTSDRDAFLARMLAALDPAGR